MALFLNLPISLMRTLGCRNFRGYTKGDGLRASSCPYCFETLRLIIARTTLLGPLSYLPRPIKTE